MNTENIKIPAPRKELPDYTFDHEPTVREMRDNIVRAMHDMLSVAWYSPSGFDYYKNGAVAGKHFMFAKEKEYLGIPYTDANKTLFGFMEYYDRETGRLKEDEILADSPEEWKELLGQAVNVTLGNTCTGSTGWAYASTCSSVRGGFVSYFLTPKNGFYPVGDYTFDFSVENLYSDTTTLKIMAENGEEKMMECLALVQKADLVTMNGENPSTGHSMMALGDAVVKRDGNGKIVPEESYILIQDQRAGFFDVVDETGSLTQTSGRLLWKATFRFLFDTGYMPVASAELLGKKKWEAPVCELKDGVLKSNYAMAVVKYVLKTADGEKRLSHFEFSRREIASELAFRYPVAELLQKAEKKIKEEKLAGDLKLQVI